MTEPVVDVVLTPDDAELSLRQDARQGLTSTPKWLAPKWFYDARGSDLFEQITRLPEYYPTRAESSILSTYAIDIATRSGAHTLVARAPGPSRTTPHQMDAPPEGAEAAAEGGGKRGPEKAEPGREDRGDRGVEGAVGVRQRGAQAGNGRLPAAPGEVEGGLGEDDLADAETGGDDHDRQHVGQQVARHQAHV